MFASARTIAAVALAIAVLVTPHADAAPRVDERELLGESYGGRPIRVFHRGDPEDVRVLVVGCIHGDETEGIRIAGRLRTGRPRHFLDLWILPNLNPDGRAANTRQSARGVDLNRNFPYRWEPGPRGRFYPGRRPASEVETRIAMRLIERIEPDITIWFHQPLGLVDASGHDTRIERRYARLVHCRSFASRGSTERRPPGSGTRSTAARRSSWSSPAARFARARSAGTPPPSTASSRRRASGHAACGLPPAG